MGLIIVFILFYVILSFYLVWRALNTIRINRIYEEKCPPHQWTIKQMPETGDDETYFMVCSKCNKFPGQDNQEE